MAKALAPKSQQRSEELILDDATQQLLRVTKEKAKKMGKPLRREKLRQEGYSERFIAKVENV